MSHGVIENTANLDYGNPILGIYKESGGLNESTSDIFGAAVVGAGRTNIEKDWYRTLSTKLTTNSGYAAAREGAITSAIELYGASSQTCKSVEAAFNAITVPAGSATCGGTTPPTDPPPSGANLLGNPGFESGATVWTSSSGAITNNTSRPPGPATGSCGSTATAAPSARTRPRR